MNWMPIDPVEHERRIGEFRRIEEIFYLTADWDYLDRFYAPNITVEELRQRYVAGDREFIDICLPQEGVDLSGVDLSNASFLGARLCGGGTSRANLSGINLRGCDLRYVRLGGANLREANLTRTNISEAYLRGCDLTGAYLNRTILSNADIAGAKLIDVKMRDAIGQFGMANNAFFGQTVELADGSVEIRGEYESC
jgi:uncharacterized protein YjbI with pentapeptide repeats